MHAVYMHGMCMRSEDNLEFFPSDPVENGAYNSGQGFDGKPFHVLIYLASPDLMI